MTEICWMPENTKNLDGDCGKPKTETWPSAPLSTSGSLAFAQPLVPGQGFYPGSYEYKYSLAKWNQVMNTIYQNASDARSNSEYNRADTKWSTAKLVEKIDKNQADATHTLRERHQDVTYWKVELQRTIEDLISELVALGDQKIRLERLLRTSEIPAQINLECGHARDRRQLPDRVNDKVDQALYKELVIIRSSQEILKKMINEADNQIRRLRNWKEQCEFDWGDKWESANIEEQNCKMKNSSRDVILRHGAIIPLPSMATNEEWNAFTRNLITNSENERSAAVRLRAILEGFLSDASRDLRDTADEVDRALDERIGEMEEALQKLEHHRDKVLHEITMTEKQNNDIQKMLGQMECSLRVNTSRLDNRKYRSGIEKCRDIAHNKLLDEHQDILDSSETMLSRFKSIRQQLDFLERSRLDLEKEISVKCKSLFIDRNKCKFARNKFPAYSTLLGYQ